MEEAIGREIGSTSPTRSGSPHEPSQNPTDWNRERAHKLLVHGHWFRELHPELQSAIVSAGEIRQVRRGALYRSGARVDGLYATLDGDVRYYGQDGKRERAFIRALGPATWFGVIPVMNAQPRRTFEVWCAGPTTLFFLSCDAYRALTTASPDAYRAFVRLLSLHMGQVTRMMMEARAEAPSRTAHALIHLAQAHGRRVEDGIEIGIRLSQEDLASLVGVSRQYLNELLQRWGREGLIRWKAKGHHIVNLDRVKSILSRDTHRIALPQ